jgi:hypothetical protein
MKRDTAVRIRARRSVFQIPLDRAAEIRELAADLMVTAGKKFHLYKPISVSLSYLSVIQFSQFGILAGCSRAAYI